jgi:hypothetical protein
LIALLAEFFASPVDVLASLVARLPRLFAKTIRTIMG